MESISLTDVLSPFINDGDKEPSWDGNIYIHIDKQKSKNGIKKVPVQVKGKIMKKIPKKKKTSFSIACTDLDNWLNDGGIMLFVILIDETGTNKAIYYSALLPLKIKDIKETAIGRKNIKIPIRVFSRDNKKKVEILLDFYNHRQKQMSFANAKLYDIKDFAKENLLESIMISSTTYGEKNEIDLESLFLQKDIYLYAQVKGSSIPQPLQYFSVDSMCCHVTGDVKVKDHVFYSQYSVTRYADKDETCICIGKSIKFEYISEKEKGILIFKTRGTLSDYIRDTECFIAIIENREITINATNFLFDDTDDVNIEQQKQNLLYYKNVKKMLDILGVTKELECDNLSVQDQDNIRKFTSSLVLGRNIEFTGYKNDLFYGYFKLANLKILIWVERLKEKKNAFRIQSYFSDHNHKFVIASEKDKNISYLITHYILLKKRDFLDAANIDYEKIVNDIYRNDTSSIVTTQIISFMLEMLKAYDEQKIKDKTLLKTAEACCDWLTKNVENANDIMILNHFQIIKRRRCLNEEEISQLQELRKTSENLLVKCGASILLGKMELAQDYFDKMEENEKENFINYPICHLGKPNYNKAKRHSE